MSSPSLYVLNPTGLSKPNALQQLQADITGGDIDIILISETWFKPSVHSDALVQIEGFNIFRNDRLKRRGGRVVITLEILLLLLAYR